MKWAVVYYIPPPGNREMLNYINCNNDSIHTAIAHAAMSQLVRLPEGEYLMEQGNPARCRISSATDFVDIASSFTAKQEFGIVR